jgi:hypothetical protein
MFNKCIFVFIFSAIQVSIIKGKNSSIFDQKLINNEFKQISIKPELSNVKYIGRYLIKEGITYLLQSGSAIEFYLTAKSAEIILAGDGTSIYHEEYEKPRYAIYVNDSLLLDTTMGEREKTVLLFNIEKEMEIKIKVILLSEAIFGGIGIKSINAISTVSSNKIIRPTEKKKLSIEYVGDSITCAFGIEAKAPSEYFETKTQNFEKSYAFLASKELDYDYSVVCYSGCGIISTGNIMSQRYTKINYFSDINNEWDFKKHHNDIIVINLGTNDFDYVWGFRIDEYVEKYAEFLKLVREKNPDSYIICLLGMMGCEDLYPLIIEAIILSGDKKIFSYLLPTQRIEDGIGAEYHPNVVSHAKWGKLVAKIIRDVIEGKTE